MLIMALSDVFALPVTTFISGYFSFHGLMFCNAPVFVYIIGIFGFGCWSLYTSTSLILAVNRCLAFTHYSWIFEEWRRYVWIAAPFVYSLLIFAFARAPIWNSIYGGYFFNPHLSYFEDRAGIYNSPAQIGNNLTLSILLPSIYFLFYLSHSVFSRGRPMPKKEHSLFIQIFIMNTLLSCASCGYVLMQFIDLPEQIVCVTHLAWILIQSCPPFIYLTMNTTIQRTVFPRFFRVGAMLSTSKRPAASGDPQRAAELSTTLHI
ncbi:hypothetical protein M3Y99_01069200 [Aphelenchoides fujianensis]|nr:hypothetical protein M3Y99_01069200 [Aphelenchoides fujianensis]